MNQENCTTADMSVIQMEIPEDVFDEKYKPLKNPFDEGLGWNGCLLDPTYPDQLEYINKYVKQNRVWTVLDVDGELIISAGYSFVNRFGYVITEHPRDALGGQVIVDW